MAQKTPHFQNTQMFQSVSETQHFKQVSSDCSTTPTSSYQTQILVNTSVRANSVFFISKLWQGCGYLRSRPMDLRIQAGFYVFIGVLNIIGDTHHDLQSIGEFLRLCDIYLVHFTLTKFKAVMEQSHLQSMSL